jgi:hypothetical protein
MTANSTNSTSGTNRISTFVIAAIYITLVLSVVAIIVGVAAFFEGFPEVTIYLLAIGFIAMGLSGYYLLQSRKHVANLRIESPQILTTIECKGCNEKVTREFKRGDYVFKEGEKCTKCSNLGMIVAIYREVKEKEKQVNV